MYNFLYAGGLHFKRYETLNLLAKSIAKYNLNTKGKKAILKIYSGSEPSRDIKRYLNIKGASMFCGSLTPQELKVELNRCDIPVHVESFDRKCIESTRLSISTKIPEYLSLGKPVLAIGPSEVASMKYLEECAFCITNSDIIYEELMKFLADNKLKENLSNEALNKFNKNHNTDIYVKVMREHMQRLINN